MRVPEFWMGEGEEGHTIFLQLMAASTPSPPEPGFLNI